MLYQINQPTLKLDYNFTICSKLTDTSWIN